MKKIKIICTSLTSALMLFLLMITIASCKHKVAITPNLNQVNNGNASASGLFTNATLGGGETKISNYGSFESHNMGQNCMNCHSTNGSGEGWFNVGGTVYDSTFASTYPNATVKLYSGPNGTGTLIKTIQVDGRGNFYTTQGFGNVTTVYPSVQGNNVTMYMASPIPNGQCNNCHGSLTTKIWVK